MGDHLGNRDLLAFPGGARLIRNKNDHNKWLITLDISKHK
jgi:hypothetical protein